MISQASGFGVRKHDNYIAAIEEADLFDDDATKAVRDEDEQTAEGSRPTQRKHEILGMRKNGITARCACHMFRNVAIVSVDHDAGVRAFVGKEISRPEHRRRVANRRVHLARQYGGF